VIIAGGTVARDCGKAINHNHPYCLHQWGGPGLEWPRREPQPAGGKSNWCKSHCSRDGGEAA
jgi:hypothetical protein